MTGRDGYGDRGADCRRTTHPSWKRSYKNKCRAVQWRLKNGYNLIFPKLDAPRRFVARGAESDRPAAKTDLIARYRTIVRLGLKLLEMQINIILSRW